MGRLMRRCCKQGVNPTTCQFVQLFVCTFAETIVSVINSTDNGDNTITHQFTVVREGIESNVISVTLNCQTEGCMDVLVTWASPNTNLNHIARVGTTPNCCVCDPQTFTQFPNGSPHPYSIPQTDVSQIGVIHAFSANPPVFLNDVGPPLNTDVFTDRYFWEFTIQTMPVQLDLGNPLVGQPGRMVMSMNISTFGNFGSTTPSGATIFLDSGSGPNADPNGPNFIAPRWVESNAGAQPVTGINPVSSQFWMPIPGVSTYYDLEGATLRFEIRHDRQIRGTECIESSHLSFFVNGSRQQFRTNNLSQPFPLDELSSRAPLPPPSGREAHLPFTRAFQRNTLASGNSTTTNQFSATVEAGVV